MRFVFLMLPAYGHVHPSLPIARELVSRGEEVIYYLTGDFEAAVRSIGAQWRALDDSYRMPDADGPGASGKPTSFRDIMPSMMSYLSRSLRRVPELRKRVQVEEADCIVYDPMCSWGRVLPSLLGRPAATLSSTYALRPTSPILRQLKEQQGLPTLRAVSALLEMAWAGFWEHVRHGTPRVGMFDLFYATEPLNIVPLPRRFQPDADELGERFLFVGPALAVREDAAGFPLGRLEGAPTLFISLGTTTLNRRPDFYAACFEAFGGTRWQVVLPVGKGMDMAALGPAPDNFLVRSWVPQVAVLERARVFITHGGMNSTMEALWHGVPLVVCPQMPEQAVTASRVVELGLGVRLEPGRVDAKALREAVEALAGDEGYRARVADFQQHLHEGGGPKRAADVLQQMVRRAGRAGEPAAA